jgi:hypothetical protein
MDNWNITWKENQHHLISKLWGFGVWNNSVVGGDPVYYRNIPSASSWSCRQDLLWKCKESPYLATWCHNLYYHNMNLHSCLNLSITFNFLLPNTKVKLHIMATIHLTSSWCQATAKHVHTTMYLSVCVCVSKKQLFYLLTISGTPRFFWRLGQIITMDAHNREKWTLKNYGNYHLKYLFCRLLDSVFRRGSTIGPPPFFPPKYQPPPRLRTC